MRIALYPIMAGIMITHLSYAQSFSPVVQSGTGLFPSFVVYPVNAAPSFTRGQVLLSNDRAEVVRSEQALEKSLERDALGMEHYKYQQTKDGIPIEHAEYILHVKNGKVLAQNGVWVRESFIPSQQSAISEADALQKALGFMNAHLYKWQVPAEEALLKKEQNNLSATYLPKGKLVYYSGVSGVDPAGLRLAYKFDIYAEQPLARKMIFVDAQQGSIIGEEELVHTANAPGSASTVYSGAKGINADYTGASYRLRETGRGNGLETYNMQKTTSYSGAVDFLDSDNNWNNVNVNLDEYAADAHWGAEATYDYFKVKYGRNSVDNKGYLLKSYVHYSTNYFNAFWDGTKMVYGDGSSTNNYKPLTTLDICGHEITHGVTTFTSNLVYSYESGALNEAFSDIFGTAIEFYARPGSADWQLGKDFGYVLRDMSNPNLKGHPDTYLGKYWYSGTGDNGGVHTNSGVLNYWFYLLCMGGTGTNDVGWAFNVTGIGMDKAAAIAYRTNTVYLTSSSRFSDARVASIQAAKDLYGSSSNEALQVTNAWNAVGVAQPVPPPLCNNNFEPNNTLSAALPVILNKDTVALIATSTDKDWYKFTTDKSAPNFSIFLTNLPADYDVRLFNSTGTQLKVSQNGGTADERIVYNTTSTATYYIQVVGFSGAYNATKCYLLRVSTSGTALLKAEVPASRKAITAAEETVSSIRSYPNPVRGLLNLQYPAAATGLVRIRVMDMAGKVVQEKDRLLNKGLNHFTIDCSTLNSGTYLLQVGQDKPLSIQVLQ
jgi:Zn-dependent metalloprotease